MKRNLIVSLMIAALIAVPVGQAGQASAAARAKSAPARAPAAAISPTDPTKVPHYFGPYPNWANSPQVLSDAIVTISNGGGTGATATATVDPKTGGITTVAVTTPGSGYTSVPDVAFTAPGALSAVPASATAVISAGVIKSIAVVEPGYGFTTPAVAITGGTQTLTGTPATAAASGGVDNLALTDGGSGYKIQPLVEFSLPQLATGTSPTATAVMDANGVVTSLNVVTPGSGYTTAPTVTVTDAGAVNATGPAVVAATIGIGQIDVTSGGTGYTSAPTVTITDTVGVADKGATATATIAALGAVTDINVTVAGSGYLTPGLKKFVDTLPGLGPNAANDLGQYIPVAVPDTTTYPGADYYEIAVVQYRMKFHKDLPATLLRGYVQISTTVIPGSHVALSNANLTGADTPIATYFGVDSPHYLGPTIVATKNRPVRILFRNLLPTGVDGDLFLPVDTSVAGSGAGPNMTTLDAQGVPVDNATNAGLVTDGVRNPACGETPKPSTCYSENRASLHLHGGVTPWISDGTPHQWTTPAGEGTDYPKGVSVKNVPDMPDPGPGAETFFYTNQQSARMMFYHDHSWGITRLNVYAGEAAGYLITDPTEQALTAPGGALAGLGTGTPLIIQDKSFVPSPAKLAQVDPTWNSAKWGGEGNLWTPHVYMPAQNPSSPSGSNAFGRWMYGPWFWPPAKDAKYPPIANPYYDATCDPNTQPFCEPALIPSTPNVSVGMEAFNDTPLVNGAAYPTTTVKPQAYRYQILNAANDRFWNLQWYVADPTTGTLSEVALKAPELAAAQTDPNVVPTPDLTKSPAGPSWIQIGTEGGFLPAPVIVPNQPTTWITDPTRFDFGNVDKHALVLGPAERADVVVDFSQYKGKTLILYNDAPAAYPGRISSYDYYTGGPDLTSSGGAPTTLPGYGPNTRTIMQVTVSNTTPALAFDRPGTTADRMGALIDAFAHHLDASGKPAGVFEAGSDPVIVGQAGYNSAYGTSFVASGYCSSPTNPSAKCDGMARIQQQGGDPFKFDTLAGPQVSIPLQPKGLHDETNSANFDDWGRMSANLGLEAPGATPLLQNIILYPYVNPPTETFDSTALPSSLAVTPISTGADGTQIWKITHNGVDTHPIHFHLYDVQVINRVTWDNIIIPPDPTELGWKETVRASPLEDTIVAVRPIVPTLPFGVPDSIRLLNPMLPVNAQGSLNGPNGTEAGFNNTDANGNPIAPIKNVLTNFGWEYVYHCHILSHEEMDMMRPVTVDVARALPVAPVLSFTRGSVILAWTDGTPVDYLNPTSWTNPGTAEVGYRIDRALVDSAGAAGAFAQIGTSLANVVTYTDYPVDPTNTYDYRVTAWNAAGDSPSNVVRVEGVPKAPTLLTATAVSVPALPAGWQVNVNWTNNATNATNVVVERAVGTGTFSVLATLPATDTSYTDKSVVPGTYSYQVKAIGATGSSAYAGPVSVTVLQAGSTTLVLSAPNASFVGQAVTFTATVSSAAAAGTPTGAVDFIANGSTTNVALTAGVATFTTSTLPAGTYNVTANYSGDPVFLASTASVTQTVNKYATTTVVVSTLNPSLVGQPVTFTATVSGPPAAGTLSGSVDFIANATTTTVPLTAGAASFTTSTLPAGTYTVTANYSGDLVFLASTASVTQAVNVTLTTTTVASSLNPSLVGQPVTFTATVVPPPAAATPSETVSFNVNGVNTPVPLDIAGVAQLTTSALPAGTFNITAAYSGDSALSPSSGAVSQVVNKTVTATVAVSSLNPSVAGGSVTFTATVSPSVATGTAATGIVNFIIDGLAIPVPINAGQATYTTTGLTPKAHAVSASYSGDAVFAASSSIPFTQTVGPVLVPTTTTVISNRVPTSTFRQTVTFTATVSPIPTGGTVQFTIDGVTATGALALNTLGRASYSTATLTAGSHSVIAVYSGWTSLTGLTGFAGGGSATITQVVNQSVSTVTVTSNRNPSSFGQAVTLTARVNTLLATGNVVFTIDTAVYPGPVTLDATGRATLVVSSLAIGTHTVSATYGGSVNFLPSTSANFAQTVTKAASRTRLASNRNPSNVGTPVVFTATVTVAATGARTGTGTVQFLVNGTNVGTPALLNSSSQATYVASGLAVGTYTVTAIYSGDANLNTSTARAITQLVQ